ncbi:MAG: ferrous iron transport protein B, partial [Pararhodobacter sp.]|nr:ferrous iron transport protein B [Pararhodobacter sp.]
MTDAVAPRGAFTVALVGQPNAGKTTLFNRLTGSRQKVGNYAGVTVERRVGDWTPTAGAPIRLVDLPGLYELAGDGLEEWIAAGTLLGLRIDTPRPDAAILVLDVTMIERGLHLVGEVMALGIPAVVALNMADLAAPEGVTVNADALAAALGLPVVSISARRGEGLGALAAAIEHARAALVDLPRTDAAGAVHFMQSIRRRHPTRWADVAAASPTLPDLPSDAPDPWLAEQDAIAETAERWISAHVRRAGRTAKRDLSRRIDDVLVHPVWGLVLFLATMFLVFQSVYAWSEPFIGMIESGLAWAADALGGLLGDTMLREILVDAGFYGAGNVIVFLPQILILFFWIAILEESGYLARVAFMIDRPMRAAGLSGRSFIPLLSSFACAVPGIMAARTIEHPRIRLVTILVAPLMTCSARLPVYTLIIGAFVPERSLLGFNMPGLVLFGLYASGVIGGLIMARMISAVIERGIPIPMILELPLYRMPDWRNVALAMYDRFRHEHRALVFDVLPALPRRRDPPACRRGQRRRCRILAYRTQRRRHDRTHHRTGHRPARLRLEDRHFTDCQ